MEENNSTILLAFQSHNYNNDNSNNNNDAMNLSRRLRRDVQWFMKMVSMVTFGLGFDHEDSVEDKYLLLQQKYDIVDKSCVVILIESDGQVFMYHVSDKDNRVHCTPLEHFSKDVQKNITIQEHNIPFKLYIDNPFEQADNKKIKNKTKNVETDTIDLYTPLMIDNDSDDNNDLVPMVAVKLCNNEYTVREVGTSLTNTILHPKHRSEHVSRVVPFRKKYTTKKWTDVELGVHTLQLLHNNTLSFKQKKKLSSTKSIFSYIV